MFKWIDHVVIGVEDVAETAGRYRDRIGLEPEGPVTTQEPIGLKRVVLPLGESGRFIELAEPLGPDTPLGRSIARRGEGLHLVALAVDDLKATAQTLADNGVRLIGDPDSGGMMFIHPSETGGVLLQLVER